MYTGAATVENSMAFPQKKKKQLKMELPFDPVTPMLGLYLKNPKIPKEPMHPNVHTCVIYNSQVLETA